jgi:hypothetical protein
LVVSAASSPDCEMTDGFVSFYTDPTVFHVPHSEPKVEKAAPTPILRRQVRP